MNARDFCFWLQGYFELVEEGPSPHGAMDPAQVNVLKDHLKQVFKTEAPTDPARARASGLKEALDLITKDSTDNVIC